MKKTILAVLLITLMFLPFYFFNAKDKNLSTLERIQKDGYLVIATEAGFAPMEYYEGYEITGIDIDIANEIAKELGVKLYKPLEMEFGSLIPVVHIKKAHMAIAGISITEERQEQVDFTDVYFSTHQVILSREDNQVLTEEDLLFKNVGAQLGTTGDFYIEELDTNPILYDKYNYCVEALKNGNVDAVVMDIVPAESFLKVSTGLVMSGSLFEDTYGIVVKKGDAEFIEELNRIIKKLKDNGKIEEFTKKHVD